MSEPTHKIVNGVKVDLTTQEIAEIKSNWKIEDEKKAERFRKKELTKQAKLALKQKLNAIGLSDEDLKMMNFRW